MDPYNTPESPILDQSSPLDYHALDFPRLKKLYYRSVNLNVIAFLWLLGFVFLVITLGLSLFSGSNLSAVRSEEDLVIALITVLFGVAAVGLYLRKNWGRILGIIGCFFTLLGIPIGTMIGIAGLFALFGSPELFGVSRPKHKELKTEFKARKKIKS